MARGGSDEYRLLATDAEEKATNLSTAGSGGRGRSKMAVGGFVGGVFVLLAILSWSLSVPELGDGEAKPLRRVGDKWDPPEGIEGPTVTGSEAFAAVTGYPVNNDHYPLRWFAHDRKEKNESFNLLHHMGYLSPWRSIDHGLDGTAEVPAGCELERVQLLHRHGARYPTTGGGPNKLIKKVGDKSKFKASGTLDFLNEWVYKLGSDILTPFGREQMFDLGVGFRVRYGRLLENAAHLPVFRTETQDRMLKSALNFAAGFFGIPYENQYRQLVTVEDVGFNNTLAPYMVCPNGQKEKLDLGPARMSQWKAIYLAGAVERLNKLVNGIELSIDDVFEMQLSCAYETVALGASRFCEQFSADEWKGFSYTMDLLFFYSYSFGHPVQQAMGLGWVEEWLARETKTPLASHRSTTNSTLHTPDFFPLDQQIYVDATHDTVISAILTTLNMTYFSQEGELPADRIPVGRRSFDVTHIAPFGANLHSQTMVCGAGSSTGLAQGRYVRWILNDGVVPIDNMEGCERNKDGLCAFDAYIGALKKVTGAIDFDWLCHGDFDRVGPILEGRPRPV